MPDGTYSLPDLCGLADVTPRTVRYYIAQGLLRSPGTSGPSARYDDGHLARLRLIRRLQREHLPLAEIRSRLAALTDDEAILQAEGPAGPPADSALDYVRGVLGVRAALTPPIVPAPPILPAPPAAPRTAAPARNLAGSLLQRRVGTAEHLGPAPAYRDDAIDLLATSSPELPVAERSQWERFVLAPDVELHVRRPLTRSQNRGVARLLEAARQLLEEDKP
jgi:DNA-binding transcriptional MerR regulator